MTVRPCPVILAAVLALPLASSASPVINELMFHPPSSLGNPENVLQEWIEVYNPDTLSADVSGWKFTKGVNYTLPAATTVPAGGYLVIAANVAEFTAAHPGFAGTVVGGWVGQLSNSGEQIQLEDAAGTVIDDLTYANEGDWAVRVRGPLSFSHRGWLWECLADGGGSSMELMLQGSELGIATGEVRGCGLVWKSSTVAGGTPGAANSTAAANVTQTIALDVHHKPDVPKAGEPIKVYAKLPPGGITNRVLHWRTDGAAGFGLAAFVEANPDSLAAGPWEGVATIPGQAPGTVIEYYVDSNENTPASVNDSWPRMARTSNPGIVPETYGHACNALIQVDDSFNATADFTAAGNQPIYRLIMTNAERLELLQIGTTSGEEESTAEMNGTFVSHDGTGTKVRYLSGFRNRGQGSALGPPNNYHVSFRSDDRWNGRKSIAMNCQYVYSQALGQALMARAGLATQDAAIVQVRVNGADLAETGGRMYGRYVRLEGRGGDWAENHFPLDPDGNFYRLDDHAPNADTGNVGSDRGSGEFRFEGTTAAAYSDTFYKETNKEENDYTDLANFCKVVSAPATGGNAAQPAISDAAYPAALGAVLDTDEFFRFLAADALIGNQEGGLQSGRADDTSLYRGVIDPRFKFVPHDLDDVFDIGNGSGNPITRSIFSYDYSFGTTNAGTGVVGLARLFQHPQLLPKYYSALLQAMDSWFNHSTIDPMIDQIMQGWVPATDGSSATPNRGLAEIKGFIDARRASVLAEIQQNYSLATTGMTADSLEGYKVTTTGAATFAGTFNVARTYSITVNGILAQAFYRTSGSDAAGTWKLVVPAGGGSVLAPGLNNVVVRFWDGINGAGNVLQEFTSKVVWTGTAPDALTLIAPQTYVPGVPMLVRVDLKTGAGLLNRSAWNTTVNLTATNGVALSPSTVTLVNGMGSALVTVGTSTGGGTVNYFAYGTGGGGGAVGVQVGTGGGTWKYRTDLTSATVGGIPTSWKNEGFDDSAWPSGQSQIGYGDNNDENLRVAVVDYNGATTGTPVGPAYLFRSTFSIADISQLASVTGQVKYDDGAIVYVNGVEILRTAGFDTVANVPQVPLTNYSDFGGAGTNENATSNLNVPLNLLHTGVNTIAVQIHQHDNASSDMTFDLRLQGNLLATTTDPGNFTLTATAGTATTNKALTSLGANPVGTTYSGTLPTGTTNWSGVVRVTGDLTVPAGATLEIAPGTHVLMTGTTGAGSTTGADLICTSGGSINAPGTLAQPISITASDAATRWGEINVGGSTTTWQYCLISRAAHSPGGGHTGTGPAFRLGNGAVWTFDDGVVADLPGKILTNTGNTTMVMRRSQFARCVMGPETDGSGITIEDCNFSDMLPAYRESGAADDEDCIYIHDSGGRPVNLRRSVFNNCGDDAVDCLAGSLTVEDCIIRNAFDKGMSLLQNNITVRRTQIIDCDIGVSAKCQTGADESVPYLTSLENCTIVSENHPTNTSDGTFHSVGVHTRNKYGTTTMNVTMSLRNCIISAEEPVANDYGSGTFPFNVQNYTCFFDQGGTNPANPLPTSGIGNITANPQFVSTTNRDFHLATGSPCINTGDPAVGYNDPDGTRNDMGALPTNSAGVAQGTIVSSNITAAGETHWTLGGSPYHVTTSISVASGSTLHIDPGVNVQCDQNVRLTVNGRIIAQGTAAQHIVFSHVPGTNLASDVDPIKNGTQTGAPKWGGLRIVDAMSQENIVSYCDFINAQGTSPSGAENYGSLGFIRSWGWADHCTFAGTHLRMLYGRNSKLTFTYNVMPDMFIFDPVLNRIEEPTTDFLPAADNSMEPMKVEYPTTDAELSGQTSTTDPLAQFPNGLPRNGHWRVYFNEYHGNRGHQDVFDCDSGRWAARDAVTNNQSNGQFVIDCRYNHFFGLAGDEHMDLGGDAYIASNIFENAGKDYWTNDTGYSNAISSGDKGTGTTIMVARNICYDLDHVINCKASTATIFEHNTVANLHPDFQFQGQTVTQNVVCAPVNFFIPQDGSNPTYGDGAYMGFNIISNVPHVFSGPDTRKINGTTLVNDITTKIEFFHNLLDQIGDPVIGPNHAGGYFSGTYGPNETGAPGFVNPGGENYSLAVDSAAKGNAQGGLDYGASISEWAYVLNAPSSQTPSNSASLTIGGPGIVAYKWRLDGGAWSAPIQIGDGGLLPRSGPTVRQATLNLTSLANGQHTLEVLGQDMAGNWQGSDPARQYDGQPQVAATSIQWTVDTNLQLVVLDEVAAHTADGVDWVELYNAGTSSIDLGGWSLTDDPLVPAKYAIPASTVIPAGGYLKISSDVSGINLDNDGDFVQLYNGVTLVDSLTFGPQPLGFTLNRTSLAAGAAWTLGEPTPLAAADFVPVGSAATLRISEWLAASDIHFKDDWIELHNTGTLPVSLTGLAMTDNLAGDPTQYVFPPYSYIGPAAYQVFIADGDSAAGANHLSFSLDDQQETVVLLDGATVVDFVTFYPQTDDFSQGRDAGGIPISYQLPTIGFANGTSDPGYANALAILNGLRVTEIMYNAQGGNDFDWLELRNIGATAINLNGVTFVDGITFAFGNVSLNPGQNIILVANETAFTSRYGGGINVGGTYSGKLDNGGEQLAFALPSPWDANVLCFTYNDAWYLTTDGQGNSLDLVSTATVPHNFGDRDAWMASAASGGSPDGHTITAPNTYTEWLTYYSTVDGADADKDGIDSLVEFGLGLNPLAGSSGQGPDKLPTGSVGPDDRINLNFSLPQNVALIGGHGQNECTYMVQVSTDLQSGHWTTIATKSPTTNWTGAATIDVGAAVSGRVPITIHDTVTLTGTQRHFVRLSVSWTP